MRKKILFLAFIAFSSVTMVAQTTVSGTVTDAKTGVSRRIRRENKRGN